MQDKHTEALRAAIAALESQRATLGDAAVELARAPLRAQLDLTARPDAQAPPATGVEPVRRLRQVSVLFCNIVGSTQLSERLDPEDLQLALDGALAAFATRSAEFMNSFGTPCSPACKTSRLHRRKNFSPLRPFHHGRQRAVVRRC